jgi:hypothetical protein
VLTAVNQINRPKFLVDDLALYSGIIGDLFLNVEEPVQGNSLLVRAIEEVGQITSCRARAGQHARPSHKHCKACANHAHAPRPRVHTGLHDFHLVEFSHQPVLFPVKITS